MHNQSARTQPLFFFLCEDRLFSARAIFQHCHNYTITAIANIQFDSNTTNNVKEGTIRIKVRIMGDINGDGKVDMKDIALAASAFGAYPSHSRWNPDADIDENDKINLKDIALISKHFGECA